MLSPRCVASAAVVFHGLCRKGFSSSVSMVHQVFQRRMAIADRDLAGGFDEPCVTIPSARHRLRQPLLRRFGDAGEKCVTAAFNAGSDLPFQLDPDIIQRVDGRFAACGSAIFEGGRGLKVLKSADHDDADPWALNVQEIARLTPEAKRLGLLLGDGE